MRIILVITMLFLSACTKGQTPRWEWLLNKYNYNITTITSHDSVIKYGDSVWAVGTSITQGLDATDRDSCYVGHLETEIGCGINNFQMAVSGGGIELALRNINRLVQTNNTRPGIYDIGINDVARMHDTTNMKLKMRYAAQAAIASFFYSMVVPASSGSVTVTGSGTRTNITADIGQRSQYIFGEHAQTFSGNGYTISYSFTGTNVVVSFLAPDASLTSPQFNVYIDGAEIETFNIQDWGKGLAYAGGTNNVCSVAFVYGNLTNTAHTIEIEIVEDSKNLRLDYFAHMTTNNRGVLIMSPPYLADASYPILCGGGDYCTLSDALINRVARDPLIEAKKAFTEIGFPVRLIDVNTYYDAKDATQNDDGTHPKDKGHRNLFYAANFINTH